MTEHLCVVSTDPKARLVHRATGLVDYYTNLRCCQVGTRMRLYGSSDAHTFRPCPGCFPDYAKKPSPELLKERVRGRVEWFTSDRYTALAMRRWLVRNPDFFAEKR